MNNSQERETVENIRNKAMERLGQTQKRKADEAEHEGRKNNKGQVQRHSKLSQRKNEQVQAMHKAEMELETSA